MKKILQETLQEKLTGVTYEVSYFYNYLCLICNVYMFYCVLFYCTIITLLFVDRVIKLTL